VGISKSFLGVLILSPFFCGPGNAWAMFAEWKGVVMFEVLSEVSLSVILIIALIVLFVFGAWGWVRLFQMEDRVRSEGYYVRQLELDVEFLSVENDVMHSDLSFIFGRVAELSDLVELRAYDDMQDVFEAIEVVKEGKNV